LFLFLLAPSIGFSYSSPVSCNYSCNQYLSDLLAQETEPQCTRVLDHTIINGPPGTTTCVFYRMCDGAWSATYNRQFTCTGSCPTGTFYNPDTGTCKKNDCTPSSDNSVGYASDGRPKCHDGDLPPGCGYINGDLICPDEGDPEGEPPPNADPPDVDPDNPPPVDPPVTPGDDQPPIDPNDPNYHEPPEEGDPRLSTGGGDCGQPPRCSGDQIDCAALYQAWKLRCENAETGALLNPLLEGLTDFDAPTDNHETLTDNLVSDTSADLDTMFSDHEAVVGDFVEDLPSALESDNNVTAAVFDSFVIEGSALSGYIPTPGGCTDLTFDIPHNITITVDCDQFDGVRTIIEWVLWAFTVYFVFLVLTDPRNQAVF